MLELLGRKSIFRVYAGAMYSGKTFGLIKDLEALDHTDLFPYQAFKPLIDKRFGTHYISTRFASRTDEPIISIPAIPIDTNSPYDLLDALKPETKVVGIDELQFFDNRIIDIIKHLKEDRGLSVVVATLDLSFRGEPFGPAPLALAYADDPQKGTQFCKFKGKKCPNIGNRTQRFLYGEPAPYSDPLIYIEENAKNPDRTYSLRCEEHHIVPGKPAFTRKSAPSE